MNPKVGFRFLGIQYFSISTILSIRCLSLVLRIRCTGNY
ncbi:hypothetical protein SLEP1_g38449 [Rubroshorea leprosula]|nr:hypothetical protein SLEP1_g38449 [Rubroshorea leprosula]